jgi:hypothetical protein
MAAAVKEAVQKAVLNEKAEGKEKPPITIKEGK